MVLPFSIPYPLFVTQDFDLLGIREPFSSLTSYAANPVVPIVIALLIIIGGIGFLTWEDIRCNHFHIRKYRMQTKVILSVTGILIFLPTLYFFFLNLLTPLLGKEYCCPFSRQSLLELPDSTPLILPP